MWWPRALALPGALAAALALAGCGFRPMYGDHAGEVSVSELAAVQIASINERVGQQLRTYLEDRMHPDQTTVSPRYRLVVGLAEDRADLGINKSTLSTFSQLQLTANIHLFDLKTGAQLLATSARSITSYVEPTPGFPTLTSDNDARSRALATLGDDIVLRVSLYFQTKPAT